MHYLLYKISRKPSYGYELLQDIEEKTEGAWRPGPGSIYPMLKKLVSQGYIKAEGSKKGTERVYHITSRGRRRMEQTKEVFASAGERWSAMRRIFIEMIDPKNLSRFFVDGTRLQFDIGRETLEAKLKSISSSEAKFILKEYALNLQRQLDWTNEILKRFPDASKADTP